jgi:3-hydroxyisobutyrate dehydrogenase
MADGRDVEARVEPRIGFVGLGTMGGPMSSRLVAAGHAVTVFDLSPDALASAVETGAEAAESVAACAAEAEILLTSLPRPDDVIAVMRGAGALSSLPPGSIWVDLTTNRRDVIESLAAERPDVSVLDAPVTGAVDGARHGRLTLFLGGDPDVRRRVLPVISHLGRVMECGALGQGNVVKLVTNQLWFVHAAAIGEAFALGMANGVELGVLYEAICESVADSFVARHDAPSIFAGHYDPSFPLALCLKDLGLIEELAEAIAADLPLTEVTHRVFAAAGDAYGLAAGEMNVARRIEDATGLSFRLAGEWSAPWEQ